MNKNATPGELLDLLISSVRQLAMEPSKARADLPGFVELTDELVLDLEESLITLPIIQEAGLLSPESVRSVYGLDGYVDAQADLLGDEFWTDAAYEQSRAWQLVRLRAQAVLAQLVKGQ